MKNWKSLALMLMIATATGTLAYLAAMANRHSQTGALEAKLAALEARIPSKPFVSLQSAELPKLEATPVLPLDGIQLDDAPRRPIPSARAFLLNQ
jgi:hypothetical protein